MCGMLVVLSFIGEATNLAFIVACLLFLGFGYALFSSPNMNAIMGSVEKRHLGIASGSAGTMRVLGQMLTGDTFECLAHGGAYFADLVQITFTQLI